MVVAQVSTCAARFESAHCAPGKLHRLKSVLHRAKLLADKKGHDAADQGSGSGPVVQAQHEACNDGNYSADLRDLACEN
jgi:hypothetical protein